MTCPTLAPLRWDAHACITLHPEAPFTLLDALHAAGVDYISVNLAMDFNPLTQLIPLAARWRERIAADPRRYRLVNSVADIRSAKRDGALALGFDLEGAIPLGEEPAVVGLMRDLGVRQIHLAYNRNNSVADGCHDQERGLTDLGRRMVHAINAAGVLMDCSHTGRRCSLEIMACSRKPVVFSHANPLALVEHGRNITDAQIRACAATGGVVCISGVSAFLGVEQPQARDVARHAAYVAALVGVAHVGVGLDIALDEPGLQDRPAGFDPSHWWPAHAGYAQGLSKTRYCEPDAWQELPQAMRDEGFLPCEIEAILGENMSRVAEQTWGKG